MRDEYDFSGAERGKFHREGASFHLPIYLDSELLTHLSTLAAARGIQASELIAELLKRDIAELESG